MSFARGRFSRQVAFGARKQGVNADEKTGNRNAVTILFSRIPRWGRGPARPFDFLLLKKRSL